MLGGDKKLALHLLNRIEDIGIENSLQSIIKQSGKYRFHKLYDKGRSEREGYFAIDVKSSKEPWRIIISLLDENAQEFHPCNVDEIMDEVVYLRIEEVSYHYE